jgi:hypothetical protein
MSRSCYGRLGAGACVGGGVKPGIVGVAGAGIVVTLFDATWVAGLYLTPKAKPNPRIITRHARPAANPKKRALSAGSCP